MRKKKQLFVIALDKDKQIIQANDAVKGDKFFCVDCGGELLLRKSERRLRRPHFAHKSLTFNCKPESALHFGFKNLIAEKIRRLIQEKKNWIIEWDCRVCNKKHEENLFKKVAQVSVESAFKDYKPDVLLSDELGNPVAVIEVVVSHEPEDHYIDFLRKENITLVQFNLESEDDLEIINREKLKPHFVDYCFNPRCRECNGFMKESEMLIIASPCWKCGSSMKVAVINRGEGMIEPPFFNENEFEIAKKNGVLIQNRYSKTMRLSYLANVCPHCNSIVGDQFLFTDYYCEAIYGRVEHEKIFCGYDCECCNHDRGEEY